MIPDKNSTGCHTHNFGKSERISFDNFSSGRPGDVTDKFRYYIGVMFQIILDFEICWIFRSRLLYAIFKYYSLYTRFFLNPDKLFIQEVHFLC